MDVNGAMSEDIALEGSVSGVDSALAADYADAASGRHGASDIAIDGFTGDGVGGGERCEKLVELVIMAKLEQIPLVDWLKEMDAGDGGASASIVWMQTPDIATCGAAGDDLANKLAAVVGALVAHHLVTGCAVLVLGGEVAVEATLELAGAGACVGLGGGAAGKNVVQLATVDVDDGVDIIRGFHAAFELERGGAGIKKLPEHLGSVGVARA